MAIIPNENKMGFSFPASQKEKQKTRVYVLILVVLVIAAAVYFGFLKQSEPAAVEPGSSPAAANSPEQIAAKTVELIKATNLNSPIFDNQTFQALKPDKNLPVTVGATGRVNPFEPF